MAPKIVFEDVSYRYHSVSDTFNTALNHVSFLIQPGSFTAVIGRTGSGKSTLVQQINGLLRPSSGSVNVGKVHVNRDLNGSQIKKLRQIAGLVFQIPQDQLFGETVRDDLAFGPKNFGFTPDQIRSAVDTGAKLLKLTKLMSKSPFDLSGGQMKRVAIAGVLACRPEVLILDEPTVGLDHYGEMQLMKVINDLRIKLGLTVVMVTHRMNLVAKFATQVLVLNHGKLIANVNPRELFGNPQILKRAGLIQPFAPRMATRLSQSGIRLNSLPLTITDLANQIAKVYRTGRYHE